MPTKDLLRDGRINDAQISLENQIRSDPSNAKLRFFLFQLLCVTGDWQRALTQLNVAVELDANYLLAASMCRPALSCEALRAEIFAGKRLPLVFGEPEEWIGLMVRANQLIADQKYKAAQELRERAFDAAPAIAGSIDGNSFEWVSDVDSRFGPVLEAIIDGKYYWVPFTAVKKIQIESPVDLRDVVWIGAYFTWINGGETFGLIPVRYPGSHASTDNTLRLARKTEWTEQQNDTYIGLGQRVFATDKDEYAILQIRQIELQQLDMAEEATDV